MTDFVEYPEFLTHDQVIAAVQRFHDILWEYHETYQQEEQHAQKETILALQDIYGDIFEAVLCFKR